MTLHKSPLTIFISLFAFLLIPAQAELSPKSYRNLQAKAPEVLQIQLKARKSSRLSLLNFSRDRNERLEATVLSVTRSKSGLKAGDKIVITYQHRKSRGPGPRPIPKLANGGKYPAWLSKTAEGTYSPAARGFSFSVVN
ncbi:MAG: hypothetical protein P8P32_09545 [Akkermansiaceae bacterium]|nr:hypothetical protein [Akkermansiaceae bacterium]MDG2323996.1 hypothetical protein [Akkermansiaceae bacterium]